jgi:hypothetical protein
MYFQIYYYGNVIETSSFQTFLVICLWTLSVQNSLCYMALTVIWNYSSQMLLNNPRPSSNRTCCNFNIKLLYLCMVSLHIMNTYQFYDTKQILTKSVQVLETYLRPSSNRIFKNMLEFQEWVTGLMHIITAHNYHIPNYSSKWNRYKKMIQG